MSKALQGAALLGAAVANGVAMFALASTGVGIAALPFLAHLEAGLVMGGIAMEAGAIASALTSNRGAAITTRQPAAYRQIIYGEQRIGGVIVYQSTTGSHHDQYNFVIVLAGHPCDSIVNLYLDGRQVHWEGSGPGWTVRSGIGFGGNADHNDYRDEGNNKYNFGSLVYCEARYGDQLPGDVISGLTANDPTWAASSEGSPYLGGCTYVYLKIEFDTAMFPQLPEIKFTVRGKNDIYDPRTGSAGYTCNWALCVNDVLTDTEFGVGELQANINPAQLIAAANVSDEQVPLANGMTEARYTCNSVWDTATGPGDMLDAMMPAAQGRLSYIGGQWFIWPAYWQGPSMTFGESDLLKDFGWTSARPIRERYNRVKGTFTAPNFPYQVAGNLYDGNGFYDNTRQDNFNFEWQRTDAPYYAQDALHGYATDKWLAADNGKERWLDIPHRCVISVATAQRTFKIALLRNRLCAGRTTLTMSLAAYQAQPLDVIQFNFAPFGWVNKLLEVTGVRFVAEPSENGTTLMVQLDVQETDPSIYAWSVSEELTITEQPASLQLYSYQVQPPTGATAVSSSATSLVSPDGTVRSRISVTWTAPADVNVTQIQVQYQPVGSSTWNDAGLVDVGNTATYLSNVVPGASYNVQIRSVTPRGATSAWVALPAQTVASTYSAINSLGLAPGLIGNAPNTATVDAIVAGSTATVRVYGTTVGSSYSQYLGGQTLTLPAAQFTGKSFSTTYYLLWNTTTNSYLLTTGTSPSDAYVFIGSVTTPAASGTGGTNGGGGTGGPYGCTIPGTLLMTDRGEESNVLVYGRFMAGETVRLRGRYAFERIKRAEWITVPNYQLVLIDGYAALGCSDTHTFLVAGAQNHRWCKLIKDGAKIDTPAGYKAMRKVEIPEETRVLKLELEGPSHEYIANGIWTHNVKL